MTFYPEGGTLPAPDSQQYPEWDEAIRKAQRLEWAFDGEAMDMPVEIVVPVYSRKRRAAVDYR